LEELWDDKAAANLEALTCIMGEIGRAASSLTLGEKLDLLGRLRGAAQGLRAESHVSEPGEPKETRAGTTLWTEAHVSEPEEPENEPWSAPQWWPDDPEEAEAAASANLADTLMEVVVAVMRAGGLSAWEKLELLHYLEDVAQGLQAGLAEGQGALDSLAVERLIRSLWAASASCTW
jgi:hypothetical protein